MWVYTVRRLLIALPVLFVISIVDFLFINLAPGDPLQAMLAAGGDAPVSGEALEGARQAAGLNDSLPVRYVRWLGQMAQGNFGKSFRTGEEVTAVIKRALPNTLLLAGTALVFGVLFGVPLGILAALRERRPIDTALTLFSFFFTAIPGFFLALVGVFFFSVRLGWFPATGMRTFNKPNDLMDMLHHLVLPAAVLGILQIPVYIQHMRGSMLDVMGAEYVQTARAKGLAEGTVIRRHSLPNALMPVITILGLRLPALVGSSVLIERIFAWPGLGQLSINSALFRDYPVFMATALLFAVAVLLSSIITDITYALIDPRIRYG